MLAETTAIVVAKSVERKHAAGSWPSGLFHLTAGGRTSWAGFAQAILEEYDELASSTDTGEYGGQLKAQRVVEIGTHEYQTPARRPMNSVLSNIAIRQQFGIVMPDWRYQLRLALQDAVRR